MNTAHKLLLMLSGGGLSADGYIASLAPELFYKLNETSGTAVTNYGTLGGTGTWTPGVGSLNNASPLGLSYDFDGANSKIEYANNATMANAEEFSGGALIFANFAGGIGDSITLFAKAGVWYVRNLNNVSIAAA